jgi:hypothetical protein
MGWLLDLGNLQRLRSFFDTEYVVLIALLAIPGPSISVTWENRAVVEQTNGRKPRRVSPNRTQCYRRNFRSYLSVAEPSFWV